LGEINWETTAPHHCICRFYCKKKHDDVEKLFARIFDAKIEGFPRPAGKYSYGLTDTYSRDGHLIIDVKYQTAHL